jgi:NADH:ubiquinone oxidoreductase subunit 6 (subunit J)
MQTQRKIKCVGIAMFGGGAWLFLVLTIYSSGLVPSLLALAFTLVGAAALIATLQAER